MKMIPYHLNDLDDGDALLVKSTTVNFTPWCTSALRDPLCFFRTQNMQKHETKQKEIKLVEIVSK